jgi:alkylation response protein AidB-like acyl-CoA dehydrogenase
MEFQFNERERAFRDEIDAFVREWLPPDWPERMKRWPGGYGALEIEGREEKDIAQRFKQKLVEKGWATISWPKVYGGREYSNMEQAIFDERMSYYQAPVISIATGIAGPTILRFGTEENKKDWVSKIANREIEMWLGYSEPDAGSDLASIRTTAVRDGDDYIINGQKTWSSLAHVSDYAWMIARTDPEGHRHKSVSLFVVDNNTPGITIRPLINIVGLHSFNEVFFDNVRVPARNLIGQENMGFYYLMTALDFERLMVGIGTFKRGLEQLVAYVRQTERDNVPLGRSHDVRKQLAEIAVRIDVAYLFFWRTASMLDKGHVPSVESSALKLVTTELSRKMADVGMEILGPDGLLTEGAQGAPMNGLVPRGYLDCISATIGAGTSEIQRNIIAMRGLGLPVK